MPGAGRAANSLRADGLLGVNVSETLRPGRRTAGNQACAVHRYVAVHGWAYLPDCLTELLIEHFGQSPHFAGTGTDGRRGQRTANQSPAKLPLRPQKGGPKPSSSTPAGGI